MALIGLFIFILVAFGLSQNKRRISWKAVGVGLALQLTLAFLVLGIPAFGISGPLKIIFDLANSGIVALLDFSLEGSRFIFGSLINTQANGFIFAFHVLPTIIFFASFMAILYHLRIMNVIVHGMAKVMQKLMGTTGAESLSVAANVFVGQTEAPLVVKPFVKNMTRSELMALMTGGMATVAGGVLAAYVGLLVDRIPDIAGHLLTASILSAPAALVMAKLMVPETQRPETLGHLPHTTNMEKYTNMIDAAASGAGQGLKLALNVGAMLLAFIALIALFNGILGGVGHLIQFEAWGQSLVPELLRSEAPTNLSFQLVLGWLFAPLAWLMGIPWHEAALAGSLLGEKVVLNEFVAYTSLAQIQAQLSDRTVIILSYALCGFANFSSIAIQIGGIGGIAPERKAELATLGLRAVIGGSLAAFMTACVASLLI